MPGTKCHRMGAQELRQDMPSGPNLPLSLPPEAGKFRDCPISGGKNKNSLMVYIRE